MIDKNITDETYLKYLDDILTLEEKIVFEENMKNDPKIRKPDIVKAMILLKWYPQINLDDGLIKTKFSISLTGSSNLFKSQHHPV